MSHRGGRPGFVKVQEMAIGDDTIRPHSHREGRPQRLVFPDYSGNFHFSTLGNLLQHPRAGLLFWDFGAQSLLLVTGEARIVWEGPEVGFRPYNYTLLLQYCYSTKYSLVC